MGKDREISKRNELSMKTDGEFSKTHNGKLRMVMTKFQENV